MNTISNLNYLLIFFLICLSILINCNINLKHKCYILILTICLCYINPLLIIPYTISLFTIYLFNGYILKNNNVIKKKINIEQFDNHENNKENIKIFINIILNSENFSKIKFKNNSKKEVLLSELTFNEFFDIFKVKEFNKYIQINHKDKSVQLKNKVKFIKELLDCYFFNHKDIELIIKLSYKYSSVNELYNNMNFNESSTYDDDDTDKERNNREKLLENKKYKKLGLYFYKNKTLSLYIINMIYQIGLYGIIGDQYKFDTTKKINKDLFAINIYKKYENKIYYYNLGYKSLKKKIKEIIILYYYNKNKEGEINKYYYNFNKKINLEKNINLIDKNNNRKGLVDLITLTNNVDEIQKIKEKLKFLMEFKFFKKEKITKSKDKITNIDLIDNDSKDTINYYTLFPIELFNKDYNNKELLYKYFDRNFDLILENFEYMKLMNMKYYKITSSLDRKIDKFNIISNLSLIYFFYNTDFNKKIGKIKDNKSLNILYNDKKELFEKQKTNENKIKKILNFTDETDILYDNIFYYIFVKYGLDNQKKVTIYNKFIKIFKITFNKEFEDVDKDKDKEQTNNNQQTISDLKQTTFEEELDVANFLKKKKEKQYEILNDYYTDFLDKEQYDKIKTLNNIAEKRNEELKLNNNNINTVVDNFGINIIEIVDEISNQFKLLELFNNKESNEYIGCPNPSESNCISYSDLIKNIFIILTRKDRILYSGFIILLIGFFVYFIDNENYKTYSNDIKNIFDILKL